jgi:SAM-dependent methyltransferase
MKQEKIWDAFQNDPLLLESFKSARFRFLTLLNMLPSGGGGGSAILNIGIGDGGFERMCIERGMAIYSLDPNKNAIERINAITGKARAGYSSSIPFSNDFFDCVVMSEVIEHLDDGDLTASINEIARVLKPSGCFIGTTPADENLLSSICVCPDCGKRFHRYGHMQSFPEKKLSELLQSCFDRVTIRRKYLADPTQLNIKGKILRFLKILLIELGVYGGSEQFVWKAVKNG